VRVEEPRKYAGLVHLHGIFIQSTIWHRLSGGRHLFLDVRLYYRLRSLNHIGFGRIIPLQQSKVAASSFRPVAVSHSVRPRRTDRTVGCERLAVDAQVETTAVERVAILTVCRLPVAQRCPRANERRLQINIRSQAVARIADCTASQQTSN